MVFSDLSDVAVPTIDYEPALLPPVHCAECGLENDAVAIVRNGYLCAGCLEAICMWCGCTDSNACEGGCYWARPGVCSAHLEAIEAEAALVFGKGQ